MKYIIAWGCTITFAVLATITVIELTGSKNHMFFIGWVSKLFYDFVKDEMK